MTYTEFTELKVILGHKEAGDIRSFLDQHCRRMEPAHADVMAFILYTHYDCRFEFTYNQKDGWFVEDDR
jgi:hypothetical protein